MSTMSPTVAIAAPVTVALPLELCATTVAAVAARAAVVVVVVHEIVIPTATARPPSAIIAVFTGPAAALSSTTAALVAGPVCIVVIATCMLSAAIVLPIDAAVTPSTATVVGTEGVALDAYFLARTAIAVPVIGTAVTVSAALPLLPRLP